MNRVEAGVLLTYIARIDHRTTGKDDYEAWADLLDDVTLKQAEAAAREHLRTDNRWLTPALIRERVEAAEKAGKPSGPNAQSVDEALLIPDTGGDESPAAYIRALRAKRFLPPISGPAKPVAQLLAGGFQTVPGREPKRRMLSAAPVALDANPALANPCPWCGAESGHPCQIPGTDTVRLDPHGARRGGGQ